MNCEAQTMNGRKVTWIIMDEVFQVCGEREEGIEPSTSRSTIERANQAALLPDATLLQQSENTEVNSDDKISTKAPEAPQTFLICDLRAGWHWRPYITFWRPNNANYAYPLVWAGDYCRAAVDANADYYTEHDGKVLVRFAVSREVATALSAAPEPGIIDGDTGPVVRNTAENRHLLRQAAYIPPTFSEAA